MLNYSEHFAHAYLLYGNDERASENAALDLVKRAIEAQQGGISDSDVNLIRSLTYPDMMIVQAEGKNVKIDSIRKVIRFLSLAPQYADMKFAIIKQCQFLSIEAQNAMLKMLEEPLPNRMIILISDNTDNLLPTTLSRLRQVKVASEEAQVHKITDVALCENLTSMLLEGDIEKIFDVSAYLTKDKDRISEFLMSLHVVFTDIYESKMLNRAIKYTNYKEAAENISIKGALDIADIIKGAIKSIRENASPVICIEAMLISMREVYNAENSRNKI